MAQLGFNVRKPTHWPARRSLRQDIRDIMLALFTLSFLAFCLGLVLGLGLRDVTIDVSDHGQPICPTIPDARPGWP